MARPVSIFDVSGLPFWRRPIFLLFIMAVAMPIAFNVWSALLNNFVVQVANFDGSDIGFVTHSKRSSWVSGYRCNFTDYGHKGADAWTGLSCNSGYCNCSDCLFPFDDWIINCHSHKFIRFSLF